MPPSDRLRPDRIPALCQLLADEVSVPPAVRSQILEDLVYWWSHPQTIARDIGELEGSIRTLRESSTAPSIVKTLLRFVEGDDEKQLIRAATLLAEFSSESPQSTPVLAKLLKTRAGTIRWRIASVLAELGLQDDWILDQMTDSERTQSANLRRESLAVKNFDPKQFDDLYRTATDAKSTAEKGRSLEDLAEYMFLSIPGLNTIGRNIRTLAEEIDLAVSNSGEGFWRQLGDPFVVECKNHTDAVDAKTLRDFGSKLQTKGLRGGFLVTTSRLTKDAMVEIRSALRDERTIVAIEKVHLDAIANGTSPLMSIFSECFYRCRLL